MEPDKLLLFTGVNCTAKENSMKIGIEVQRIFRPKKHGMEIVSMEIIRELQKLDQQNNYILFAKEDSDDNSIVETANFKIDKSITGPYPIWEQMGLPASAKKHALQFLHCTANTAPFFCKVPTIITVHDVIYMESLSFKGSAYQNFGNLYRRLIVPRAVKNARLILTVSEYEKGVIAAKLAVPLEKIRVIYNGVNNQFVKITESTLLEAFRIKYKLPEKFILHFGNTAPKKNTIGVLQGFKKLAATQKHFLPLVLTDCDTAYITDLLKSIDATHLLEHIVVPGYIPFSEIPKLYNLATLFLYPSHRESFGMPVVEAMACGVPVITSNTSALPEIAGGAASLINPAKPNEICDAIVALLNDENLYQQLQQAGYLNAQRFSWKNAALKTLEVYNEMKTICKL
ncbi:MAG: glycosyltransferase family 1 protein [Chitinophagaceae bacterium]|nr:MAG: glycosyltransferase family 1 protein [Chitinophagaceae bacterium]